MSKKPPPEDQSPIKKGSRKDAEVELFDALRFFPIDLDVVSSENPSQ